jgi:hypothetical protein
VVAAPNSDLPDMEQVLASLAFARFGATLLLVLPATTPSDRDWSVWARAYAAAGAEHGVRSLLVVTDGGGPTATQRKEIVEGIVAAIGSDAADVFRTAVCGDSPLARFVSAAVGWLYATSMKVFAADQHREALQFARVEDPRQAAILAAIPRLQQELRQRR